VSYTLALNSDTEQFVKSLSNDRREDREDRADREDRENRRTGEGENGRFSSSHNLVNLLVSREFVQIAFCIEEKFRTDGS
jgi:hypothetical protein